MERRKSYTTIIISIIGHELEANKREGGDKPHRKTKWFEAAIEDISMRFKRILNATQWFAAFSFLYVSLVEVSNFLINRHKWKKLKPNQLAETPLIRALTMEKKATAHLWTNQFIFKSDQNQISFTHTHTKYKYKD